LIIAVIKHVCVSFLLHSYRATGSRCENQTIQHTECIDPDVRFL